MEATSKRQRSLNDDAAAALRRAVGFAGLFGLAGVAAIACTARTPQPVAGVAADRLLVQEALWTAEASGAPAIALPRALAVRRADPAIAAELAAAQRRLVADRGAAAAGRDAVIRRMDEARADRDLHEAQRTVAALKLDQAYVQREAAEQRHDAAALAALDAQTTMLKIEAARATGASARASRTLNALNARMLAMATAEHARVAHELEAVRNKLRGA